jgi:hypothetical protein
MTHLKIGSIYIVQHILGAHHDFKLFNTLQNWHAGLVYVAVLQLLVLTTILHEQLYFNVSYSFQAYLYGGFILMNWEPSNT